MQALFIRRLTPAATRAIIDDNRVLKENEICHIRFGDPAWTLYTPT